MCAVTIERGVQSTTAGTHCYKFHIADVNEYLLTLGRRPVSVAGSLVHKGIKGLGDRRLFQWLVGEGRPFHIVDSPLFREFCLTFGYKPMSRPTLSKWLFVAHSDAEDIIFEQLKIEVHVLFALFETVFRSRSPCASTDGAMIAPSASWGSSFTTLLPNWK